jgi:hypothetical protein
MSDYTIDGYVKYPEAFKALPLEDQLQVVADIAYFCAEKKNDELEAAGKTRLDACLPAQRWYDKQKYWEAVNMNIKKLAELEALRLRRGL